MSQPTHGGASMLDVQRIVTGPLQANCYLVAGRENEAVVIDPGEDFERIDAAIGAHGARPRAVLCTHAHHDHVGAAVAVAEAYGAPVHLHERDVPLLRYVNLFRRALHDQRPAPVPRADVPIEDGAELRFGELEVRVLHTPGHSPGSVCFEIAGELFSGDTLGVGGPGRADLPGGDPAALAASLRRLANRFDPETVLHPGHGEATRVGEALRQPASAKPSRGGPSR